MGAAPPTEERTVVPTNARAVPRPARPCLLPGLHRQPSKPRQPRPRLWSASALIAASLLVPGCGKPTPNPITPACKSGAPGGVLSPACDSQTPAGALTGSGASSAQPFLSRAFFDYHKANPVVTVNYSPAGSSVGIANIQANTVQFGDSEIPIPDPPSGTAGAILQIPVDLGGVALSYNLPGVKQPLKLDGPALAGIFLGTITNWDDPPLVALNPDAGLKHLAIVPVHRSDKSGPGYDVEQFLVDTGGVAWTDKAGRKPSTSWPAAIAGVGVGQQLNKGVADFITQTKGAIGYLEYSYAIQTKPPFTNAALKNASGAFVQPSVDSIAAAATNATPLLNSKFFDIVNGAGATTYPVANLNWALLYRMQASTDTGIVLGKLLDWVTTTGQKPAASLGYAPLPANVVALAHRTLLTLQTASGQSIF
ncbi:MAG: phosphate ABC transporter substrate-binding protein PstS [Actinomycetota bacterium]